MSGCTPQHRLAADDGIATAVEMMYLLVFCIVAVVFLGFLGRLHAAGVEISNTAQAAGRSASQAPDPSTALQAAQDAVASSSLTSRCAGGPLVSLVWSPAANGAWHGGSVTVRLECTVSNQALSGVWSPGSRTVVASDTQPIDRYRR